MTEPDRVRRRPRPRVDPRLLVGLGLVLASVAGVVGVVSLSDRTVETYAAQGPLVPGDRLRAEDLDVRRVALGAADELYFAVGELPSDGVMVTRAVGDGELLARSDVGRGDSGDVTSLVLRLADTPSTAIVPGAGVDVWSAGSSTTPLGDGEAAAEPPLVLVADAVVVEVKSDSGFAARQSEIEVEVLVPRERVARVLQAVADRRSISLLPSGVPIGGQG